MFTWQRNTVIIILCLSSLSLYFSLAPLKALAHKPLSVSGKHNPVNEGYGLPVHLADFENQSIKESSGIAASKRNNGIFWTHNDSGDGPFIYAVDRQGKHRGVWRVDGAKAQDWEDIAVGPGPKPGKSYIYVADIGDNSKKRNEIVVYRIAEPLITSGDSSFILHTPRRTGPAEKIRLKYPDGKHDAETLLVHPFSGDLYIITKVMGRAAGVYKLKAPFPQSGVSTLARVGKVGIPNHLVGLITGGDISPDGRRVVLCDYLGACELFLPDTEGIAFDKIWEQPPISVDIGSREQGEAICYRADGLALLATSEGLPCPLFETVRR